jgi:glycosyltransferase involved in cell wall biosynthesis
MSSPPPLISIGLPTYNRASLLCDALDSLLGQTYKNIELIISDNASMDGTQEICRKYAEKDKRIKYTRQKKNIGATDNFNFVLKQGIGDYFMWAADDDLWEPDFVSELVELHVRNKEAAVTFCAYDNITFSGEVIKTDPVLFEEGENLSKYKRFKRFLLDRGGKCNYVYGLVNREYLIDVKGFREFKGIPDCCSSADTFFALEMLVKGSFIATDKLLYHKRCNRDDFMAEEKVQNLSIFSKKAVFLKGLIGFVKTPYYHFFHYRIINDIIKKSFTSFYDRIRLYFFNTYHFLGSVFRIMPWAMKLFLSFIIGIKRKLTS